MTDIRPRISEIESPLLKLVGFPRKYHVLRSFPRLLRTSISECRRNAEKYALRMSQFPQFIAGPRSLLGARINSADKQYPSQSFYPHLHLGNDEAPSRGNVNCPDASVRYVFLRETRERQRTDRRERH